MEIDEGTEDRKVQVRFTTKLQDIPFKAPITNTVPASSSRFDLSKVVNALILQESPEWKPEPFDFLVNGVLVRMSLGQFLLAKGISAEKTLEIEYVRAVVPRKEEDPCLHDEWVSAVDGSNPGFLLTGCYDGLGRVWNSSGICTHILQGHTEPVTSVSIISEEGGLSCVATASKDRSLRLWKVNTEEPADNSSRTTAYKILRGHGAAVQSVAAHKSGEMVCSGSWDSTIRLWQTDEPDMEVDVSVKKRKKSNEAKESQLEVEAVSSLVGHTQCVSSVKWPQREIIYSASWDHSIRRWDIESGKDILNIPCSKALNCLDIGGEGSALVAGGGSDPILRIWDPRKPGTSAPVGQFKSHTSWITGCKWHDSSWFHVLSSSYDGKVMLWDMRTTWPLFIIDSHKDNKVIMWSAEELTQSFASVPEFPCAELNIEDRSTSIWSCASTENLVTELVIAPDSR